MVIFGEKRPIVLCCDYNYQSLYQIRLIFVDEKIAKNIVESERVFD